MDIQMNPCAKTARFFGLLAVLALCPPLFAQDEIRLSDGGVLQGKILNETPTSIDFRHPDFGVIQIPKSKILQMGPHGTLPPMPKASERQADEEAEARERSLRGEASSRLDLDAAAILSPPQDPLAALGPLNPEHIAGLEEELAANPDMALIYAKLIRNETLDDADSEILYFLNEVWEEDPSALSPLEQKIVVLLVGPDASAPGAITERAPPAPPPAELVPVVDAIRQKLGRISGVSYKEVYTVINPLGKVEIRYERHARGPNLAAGSGEVVEHVDAIRNGRSVNYFADGQSLWLVSRPGAGSGRIHLSRTVIGAQLADDERQALIETYESPSGSLVDFATWNAAGYPVDEMLRAHLLLDPLAIVDLSTLELVNEDEAQWRLAAALRSPAFEPMERAEFRVAKATGLIDHVKFSGNSVEATLRVSDVQVDPDLPPTTFQVPEEPTIETFERVAVPASHIEALGLVGAL
jgi:hypothetical protein